MGAFWKPSERPIHEVTLPNFRIMRREVTVGQHVPASMPVPVLFPHVPMKMLMAVLGFAITPRVVKNIQSTLSVGSMHMLSPTGSALAC